MRIFYNSKQLQEIEPAELRLLFAIIAQALDDLEHDDRDLRLRALFWLTDNTLEDIIDLDFWGVVKSYFRGNPEGFRLIKRKERTYGTE
jgi:hypothetical protein